MIYIDLKFHQNIKKNKKFERGEEREKNILKRNKE